SAERAEVEGRPALTPEGGAALPVAGEERVAARPAGVVEAVGAADGAAEGVDEGWGGDLPMNAFHVASFEIARSRCAAGIGGGVEASVLAGSRAPLSMSFVGVATCARSPAKSKDFDSGYCCASKSTPSSPARR